mmetsp:Transcript_28593/g.71979  ORF Transcript_28593/g.71979 Transcript_28593/m.71979 type:complete len:243 (+) Transcript_28593:798-1526(+)
MAQLRPKCALPERNWMLFTAAAVVTAASLPAVASMSAGANACTRREVMALHLLCASSPIARPAPSSGRSARPVTLTSPKNECVGGAACMRCSAASRAGASSAPIHLSRLRTSGVCAPKRSTLPNPSLRLQNATSPLRADAGFATASTARAPPAPSTQTHTGMDGEITPDIGPTALRVWQGANCTFPLAANFSADSGVFAHPSSMIAPITAPRIGPHISPKPPGSGGPACRMDLGASNALLAP